MLTGFRCASGTSRVTAHVIRRGHRFYARLGHCGARHLPDPELDVERLKAAFWSAAALLRRASTRAESVAAEVAESGRKRFDATRSSPVMLKRPSPAPLTPCRKSVP